MPNCDSIERMRWGLQPDLDGLRYQPYVKLPLDLWDMAVKHPVVKDAREQLDAISGKQDPLVLAQPELAGYRAFTFDTVAIGNYSPDVVRDSAQSIGRLVTAIGMIGKETNRRDPKFKAIMPAVPGSVNVRATVMWAEGRKDEELAGIAKAILWSSAYNLTSKEERDTAEFDIAVQVDRNRGVQLLTNAAGRAGLRTPPSSFRRPSAGRPETHCYALEPYGMTHAGRAFATFIAAIALAHPEDVRPERPDRPIHDMIRS
ncbi:MAG TPA: hypothetical protein VG604_02330 [Candidatus Saccharimonadales bacterium]|nr:hypothetical protein [Candidatus Saccharimonadales bacterium]